MIESNADLFFKKLKKMRNGKKRRELDDIFKVFSVNFPLENADVINRFHILREILDYLVNSEKISYPNSKKNWDKSTRPELPKWIKILINVSNENNTYLKEIPWHPELIQFSNVKNIKKSSYKDLKALNDYFSLNDIKNLPEISIKERSYQIFKDEKKLEKIIKTDWFGSRLDLTQ